MPRTLGKGSSTIYEPKAQALLQQMLRKQYNEAKFDELNLRGVADLEQSFVKATQQKKLIDELQDSGRYGTKTIKQRKDEDNLNILNKSIKAIIEGVVKGKINEAQRAVKSFGSFLEEIDLTPKIKDTLFRQFNSTESVLGATASVGAQRVLADLMDQISNVIPVSGRTGSQVVQQLRAPRLTEKPRSPSDSPPTTTDDDEGRTILDLENLLQRAEAVKQQRQAMKVRGAKPKVYRTIDRLIREYSVPSSASTATERDLVAFSRAIKRAEDRLQREMASRGQSATPPPRSRVPPSSAPPAGRGRSLPTKAQFKKMCEATIRNLVKSVKGTDKSIEDAIVKEVMEM